MISLLLVALAAACNAVMDVLSFHYKQSIFTKSNPQWWNPAISWKNKYISDTYSGVNVNIRRKLYFGSLLMIDYPIFLTDAWHFFGMIGRIAVFCCMFFSFQWWIVPLLYLWFTIVFHIFYTWIFVSNTKN